MDCRFESGAMPFGQEHYIGTTPIMKGGSDEVAGGSKDSLQGVDGEMSEGQRGSFTADFIAEGLDQTR